LTNADRERLRHDIGKYLVRIARNLDEGPVPPPLADLLIRDLYESPGGGRPSAAFARLAAAIDQASAEMIAASFARLDALEEKARRHDGAALRAAADLALEIGRVLDTALEAAA
jgi:hypothetical protein